ncbi:MAG TPA: 50S ribosomal protein L32 [Patescibacteria group bacterium]
MSVQKQRHTRARRDRARVQYAIIPKNLVKCAQCAASIRAHSVCPKCGYYKGKEVIDTMKKVNKKAKKK